MPSIGFFLSTEEHDAPTLVDMAARAEQAGFTTAWISDHFPSLERRAGGVAVRLVGPRRYRRAHHRIWPNEALPGELPQVLPTPQHFEQATTLVTEEMTGETVPCGPDPQVHLEAIREHLRAGFDEVYVSQIGPDQEGFLRF